MDPDCIFCKIAHGELPARIIYRDDRVIAFHDIHPHAPVHILVIPIRHIPSVNELSEADEALVGHLVTVAGRLADEHGLANSGYRVLINTGPDSGQTVLHLHLHLLGGKKMPLNLG